MRGTGRVVLVLCVGAGCFTSAPAREPVAAQATSAPAQVAGDASTGFDLFVSPENVQVAHWMLDGEKQTSKLPTQIRGLAPGRHMIKIDAPGYRSPDRDVLVELGRASKVVVTLTPTGEVATPPAVSARCDEVSCVLNANEPVCCARFRRTPGGAPSVGIPDSISREIISAAVSKIKARLSACGMTITATGTVKVSVRVSPDGLVTSISITQTPDAALGKCVADVMKTARFDKTVHGGAFSYPFVF